MRNIQKGVVNGLVSLLCSSILAGCPQQVPGEERFAKMGQDAQITDGSVGNNVDAGNGADGGYDSTRNPYLDTLVIDSTVMDYTDGNSVVDYDHFVDADNFIDVLNSNDVIGYDSAADGYDASLPDVNVNKDEGSDTSLLLDTIVMLDSAKEDVNINVPDNAVVVDAVKEDITVVEVSQPDIFVVEVLADTNIVDIIDSFEVGKDVALEVLLTKDVSLDVATSCYSNYFQSQNSINTIVTQNGTFLWNKGQYAQQTDNSTGIKVAYFDNFAWDKLNLQAKVRIPAEQAGVQKVGLLFRYTPLSATGYNSGVDKGYFISLEKTIDGKYSVALEDLDKGEIKSVALDASVTGLNTWHTLAIKAVGNTLNGYLNGKSVFQINDVKYSIGEIGLGTYNSTGDWDDLLSCLP